MRVRMLLEVLWLWETMVVHALQLDLTLRFLRHLQELHRIVIRIETCMAILPQRVIIVV